MAVWGGCEKKRSKSKGEKERYSRLNAEFQRIARRDKKAFLSDQHKEIEENQRMQSSKEEQGEIRKPSSVINAKK